jgi:hypothetical protein
MMTGTCEHMSAREFQECLAAAKPGETFVYATGFLAVDVEQALSNKLPTAGELNHLAGLALTASNEGGAHLTQRRVGPGRFEYRTTKANGASR